MNLNELRDKAYDIACRHGWHDEKLSDEHYLMLIITEISEAVEADIKGKHAKVVEYKCLDAYALRELHLYGKELESKMCGAFEKYIKDTVEDEFADVVIRCLDLAGMRQIDMSVLDGYKTHRSTYLVSCAVEYLADNNYFTEFCYALVSGIVTKDDLSDRLQVTILFILLYCDYKNIDIIWYIEQKMKYNKTRPLKHGGKKY